MATRNLRKVAHGGASRRQRESDFLFLLLAIQLKRHGNGSLRSCLHWFIRLAAEPRNRWAPQGTGSEWKSRGFLRFQCKFCALCAFPRFPVFHDDFFIQFRSTQKTPIVRRRPLYVLVNLCKLILVNTSQNLTKCPWRTATHVTIRGSGFHTRDWCKSSHVTCETIWLILVEDDQVPPGGLIGYLLVTWLIQF